MYCWCLASWSLDKGRLYPETYNAIASNEYAMLISGRGKPHSVSVCSMWYLLWVAGNLTLYLCVPCGIYCGSQQASPCICVFHAVFTAGRRKPHPVSVFHAVFTVGRRKPHPVSVCSMRYLVWVAWSLTLYLCSMRYLLWVAGSLTLCLCVPCGIYCGSQEASALSRLCRKTRRFGRWPLWTSSGKNLEKLQFWSVYTVM